MSYGIPSKDDLEIEVVVKHPNGNFQPLAVLEFDRHVDFTRNKIFIRAVVQPGTESVGTWPVTLISVGSELRAPDEVKYFQPHYDPKAIGGYTPYGSSRQKAVRFRSPVEAEMVLLWLNLLGLFEGGGYPTWGVNAKGELVDASDRFLPDQESPK